MNFFVCSINTHYVVCAQNRHNNLLSLTIRVHNVHVFRHFTHCMFMAKCTPSIPHGTSTTTPISPYGLNIYQFSRWYVFISVCFIHLLFLFLVFSFLIFFFKLIDNFLCVLNTPTATKQKPNPIATDCVKQTIWYYSALELTWFS